MALLLSSRVAASSDFIIDISGSQTQCDSLQQRHGGGAASSVLKHAGGQAYDGGKTKHSMLWPFGGWGGGHKAEKLIVEANAVLRGGRCARGATGGRPGGISMVCFVVLGAYVVVLHGLLTWLLIGKAGAAVL